MYPDNMSMPLNKILPAEWAVQSLVQLTWPHAATDWNYMLDEVNGCFKDIALAIIKQQNLLIVCSNTADVKALLGNIDYSRITFAEIPTNDTWARDHGGISVFENGERIIYDFTFNGWGKKFDATLDNQITSKLNEIGVFSKSEYRNMKNFILEGGSIESDGKGTLLTTSNCLLSANRNDSTQDEIERKLKEFFGVSNVLWLHHGYLAGDDTDSHIDTLARLCPNNIISYVQCKDENDEHFEELQKMEAELQAFKNTEGEAFELIALPMADAVYDAEGERLPATYANFLITNNAVLLPTYNSPKDKIAIEQIQKAFHDREVVGIDCSALIKQHGSLHCITMQYPAE